MISVEKLKKFCNERGIFYAEATRECLEASIERAYRHQGEVKNQRDCFGFWEYENSECISCSHRETCFTASMGVSEEKYFKKLEKSDRLRIPGKLTRRSKK